MIGRSLAHYRILDKLGAGGMGEVFLAEDTRLERRVALKVLSPAVAGDPEHLERFRREARTVAAVNHPNIVTVYSVEEDQGLHFLTMEYVAGSQLGGERPAGGLELAEILARAVPLADALAAAHAAGIVHRDLKPGNVMVTNGGQLKVLDFGLAKRQAAGAGAGPDDLTRVGTLLGTMAYMAPEQIRGGEADPRTDLFAAGVLIYALAAGRHPFDAGNRGDLISAILRERPAPIATLRPELGGGLDRVVGRCLEKELAERYQSAAELYAALVDLRRESRVTIGAPSADSSTGRERRALGRPGTWNLPRLRNLNFTAREDELDRLRRLFEGAEQPLAVVALVGLGGVGKSQLAVEYAYRSAGGYRVVWWMPAEEPAALRSRFAALAGGLGLRAEQDVGRTVARVRDWLGANSGWLLVFDNAEEPSVIRPYLPPGGGGRILVTSRNPAWRGLGNVLEVPVWSAAEAARFLERRTGDADPVAAGELNQALGGLPLALEQAAAYIEVSGQSVAAYTRLYAAQRLRLLDGAGGSPRSGGSVVASLTLSVRQVERASAAAAELLDLCAFLAPDDIPLDLLSEAPELLPEALGEAVADELALDETLACLLRYSLLTRVERSLSLHRLVQAVVRQALADGGRLWAERALALVSRAFPRDGFRETQAWPRCSRLLPHALTCLTRLGDDPPVAAAALLDSVGSYLDGRGQYREARSCLERALAIEEAAHGPHHPAIARRANNLGRVMTGLGRAEEARALFARALAIDEAALGRDHPTVARRLSNLGAVLVDLGRVDEAEAVLRRALGIDQAAFGPDHPTVAIRLNNLGAVDWMQGQHARAKDRLETALRIEERALGPDHPRVAKTLCNLGAVLNDQGDLIAAKEHHQRALSIFEGAFGPHHPNVAVPLRNLGEVLHALGRQRSARAHLDRALEIERAAWDGGHPNQAETLELLGMLAKDQDRPDEARQRFVAALEILEQRLGRDHPKTARLRTRLDDLEG